MGALCGCLPSAVSPAAKPAEQPATVARCSSPAAKAAEKLATEAAEQIGSESFRGDCSDADRDRTRLAKDEADRKRVVEEEAATKLANEQEVKRLSEEAAAKKLAEEEKAKRLAKVEVDRKRVAEEEAASKLAKEQEDKRLAEEAAAAKKLAKEQEVKRLGDEAAAKQLAGEEKAKRLAKDEADRKRAAEEELIALRKDDPRIVQIQAEAAVFAASMKLSLKALGEETDREKGHEVAHRGGALGGSVQRELADDTGAARMLDAKTQLEAAINVVKRQQSGGISADELSEWSDFDLAGAKAILAKVDMQRRELEAQHTRKSGVRRSQTVPAVTKEYGWPSTTSSFMSWSEELSGKIDSRKRRRLSDP